MPEREFLTPTDLEAAGIATVETLSNWRFKGKGPRWHNLDSTSGSDRVGKKEGPRRGGVPILSTCGQGFLMSSVSDNQQNRQQNRRESGL
jgi:hypothetical protein